MKNIKHNQTTNIEERIDQALKQEMVLPEGLLERLEATIDRLDVQQSEIVRSKNVKLRRYTIYSIGAAAALLLILLAIDLTPKTVEPKFHTIIYSEAVGSQENAEQLVNKALKLFSYNVNKGAQAVKKSNEEIKKTNQKINNILNRVRQ